MALGSPLWTELAGESQHHVYESWPTYILMASNTSDYWRYQWVTDCSPKLPPEMTRTLQARTGAQLRASSTSRDCIPPSCHHHADVLVGTPSSPGLPTSTVIMIWISWVFV